MERILDARKKQILSLAINEYIKTAEPVSSRLIAEKYLPEVSSATIRNELASLEEMGYLKQPHTSAGRIPSDLGYRYYVDNLINVQLSPVEEAFIHKLYTALNKEVEDLLEETTSLLARLTKYVAIVFAPLSNKSLFKHIDLVPLSSRAILLVLITETGYVEKTLLDFEEEIAASSVVKAEKILNKKLKNLSLDKIKKEKSLLLKDCPPELKKLLDRVLNGIIVSLSKGKGAKFFFGGAANLLQQPEFESLEKTQALLRTLEHRYTLLQILREALNAHWVMVKIGSENSQLEMKDCSFVATNYSIGSGNLGALGIVGPTRMDYARAISTVLCIAKNLSKILESLHNN